MTLNYKEEVNLWRISTSTGLNSTIHLFSLDVEVRLAEIYAKTEGLKGV